MITSQLQGYSLPSQLSLDYLDNIKATEVIFEEVPVASEERARFYQDHYTQTSSQDLMEKLLKPSTSLLLKPSMIDGKLICYNDRTVQVKPAYNPLEDEREFNGNFISSMKNFFGGHGTPGGLSPDMPDNILLEHLEMEKNSWTDKFFDDEVLRDKLLSLIKKNVSVGHPPGHPNVNVYYISHKDAESMYDTLKAMKNDKALYEKHQKYMKNDAALSETATSYLDQLRQANPSKVITVDAFADTDSHSIDRDAIRINNAKGTSISIRTSVLELMAATPQYKDVWNEMLNLSSVIHENKKLLNIFISRVQSEVNTGLQ